MSFSCPHFDINRDTCIRLKCECVPGRPGCVLAKNSGFAVPVEERLGKEKKPKASKSGGATPTSRQAPRARHGGSGP
jgi:hypothetical protein